MKRCIMTGFVGGINEMLDAHRDYPDDAPEVLARPDLFVDLHYPEPATEEPKPRRRTRDE